MVCRESENRSEEIQNLPLPLHWQFLMRSYSQAVQRNVLAQVFLFEGGKVKDREGEVFIILKIKKQLFY